MKKLTQEFFLNKNKVAVVVLLGTLMVGNNIAGAAGSLQRIGTIEKVDADGDGVRDDIQAFLDQSYSGFPIMRREMKRYSIALEDFLQAKTLTDRIKALNNMDASKYCSIGNGYSEEEYLDHAAIIYSMQVDTRKRLSAMSKAEIELTDSSAIISRNKPYLSYCSELF